MNHKLTDVKLEEIGGQEEVLVVVSIFRGGGCMIERERCFIRWVAWSVDEGEEVGLG